MCKLHVPNQYTIELLPRDCPSCPAVDVAFQKFHMQLALPELSVLFRSWVLFSSFISRWQASLIWVSQAFGVRCSFYRHHVPMAD